MVPRNNALLLFAKLPVPGQVKTRLSILKDGVFTPEDASGLFKAMLLDVADICLGAFDVLEARDNGSGFADEYRLYISTAPIENVDGMRRLVEGDGFDMGRISFIGDAGPTFDAHYNDAFEKVWADGADCILSMGADMPALTVWDVVRGFESLHDKKDSVVIAADQQMGVSIVGWNKGLDFDHDGVFYNADGLTVLSAYISKARGRGIPATLIPPVPDVDTIEDLAHSVTLLEAADYASLYDGNVPAKRTMAKLEDLGCYEVRVPANELMDSRDFIDK